MGLEKNRKGMYENCRKIDVIQGSHLYRENEERERERERGSSLSIQLV